MSLNYQITAQTEADLYANPLPDQWCTNLMNNIAKGLKGPIPYQYDMTSTATDDGDNVIKPTSISGAGRHLKRFPNGTRSQSIVSRPFNTAFQISTSRDAEVNYTGQIASVMSLTGGQTGTIFLETSPDNVTWTTIGELINGETGTLTIGLSLTNTIGDEINAIVLAGYYVRLRTTGTSTLTYITGVETLL